MSLPDIGAAIACLLGGSLLYLTAYHKLLGRQLLATGPAVFLALQAPFFVGMVLAIDWTSVFDVLFVGLVGAGLAAFIGGGRHANRLLRFQPVREVPSFREADVVDDLHRHGTLFTLLMAGSLCMIIGFLFASRVGTNAFLYALQQLGSLGEVNRAEFSAIRTGVTRDSYVAAGYVIQFTGVILPAIGLLAVIRGRVARRPSLWILAGAFALADIYFLTIVGGRKYLLQVAAIAALMFVSATSPLPRRLRASPSWTVAVIVLGAALFAATSVLQGRVTFGDDPFGLILAGPAGVYNRLGGEYSAYQLQAISLIRDRIPAWGGEWLHTLSTVLPGPTSELTLDAELHGLLFGGNTRGSAPLNVWSSIYYNWGLVGSVAIPYAMGFVLQWFTVRHILRAPKRLSATVLLSIAGYRFALWRDPYSILLEGGLTLVLFYALHRATSTPASAALRSGHRSVWRRNRLDVKPERVSRHA